MLFTRTCLVICICIFTSLSGTSNGKKYLVEVGENKDGLGDNDNRHQDYGADEPNLQKNRHQDYKRNKPNLQKKRHQDYGADEPNLQKDTIKSWWEKHKHKYDKK